jgi:hypothetical protein
MSDKNKCRAEVVASASVKVQTPFITFNSEAGFRKVVYNSTGVYTLELEHGIDPERMVVQVTQGGASMGDSMGAINASILDAKHIQVNSFNGAAGGGPADANFWITVSKISREHHCDDRDDRRDRR